MLIFTYASTSGVQCIAYYIVWWIPRIDHYDESSWVQRYRHVIISFMTFWPCRTCSDQTQ